MSWKNDIWKLANKLDLAYTRDNYSPIHAWNAIVAELERLSYEDLSDCYIRLD